MLEGIQHDREILESSEDQHLLDDPRVRELLNQISENSDSVLAYDFGENTTPSRLPAVMKLCNFVGTIDEIFMPKSTFLFSGTESEARQMFKLILELRFENIQPSRLFIAEIRRPFILNN